MISNDFPELYAGLTDDELEVINPDDLVPEALQAWQSELARRARPQYREAERLRLEAKAQDSKKNLFIGPISFRRKKWLVAVWTGINLAVVCGALLSPALRQGLLDLLSDQPRRAHTLQRGVGLPGWAIERLGIAFFWGLLIIASWPRKQTVKNSYVNFAVRGPGQAAIAECLRSAKRTACVGRSANGVTIFFDQASDRQDESIILALGKLASENLNAPVMAVLNHDDDVLAYWLFEAGQLVDEYSSCPDYAEYGDEPPAGGDAGRLVAAFGVPARRAEVELILRDEDFIKEVDRHKALADLLRHPWPDVSMGLSKC